MDVREPLQALALASAAVGVLYLRTRYAWQLALCAILLLGNTAVDRLGSGLEGPLAPLLLSGFAYVTVDKQRAVAGLLASLLLLCRLDLILLIGPGLLYTGFRLRHSRRSLLLLIGGFAAPLLAWVVWAYQTYGYVLSSTFAAKTNSEIPLPEPLSRGVEYVDATVRCDPLLLIVAALGRCWGCSAALQCGWSC